MMPAKEICGVILAGGKSLRMGRDKALLEVRGQSMIARAANEMSFLTDEIFISADDPARYQALGFPVIPDVYRGQGPLAGLHAAMNRSRRSLVLLLACDLPHVKASLLRRLIDSSTGFDAVIPRSSVGMVHPLCAVYRRTCLAAIEAALVRRSNKMTAIFEEASLNVRWLSAEEGCYADEDLANLNSPKDLEDYLASTDYESRDPGWGGKSEL